MQVNLKKRKKNEQEEISDLYNEIGNRYIPRPKANLPYVAVTLGLIHPKYYKVIKACDGKKDIISIAKEIMMSITLVKKRIERLARTRLIYLQREE
ncbi:MAG: hypothetical protein GF364_05105 [Candidatus Lokiarchaeota archaeon]|nr:hypothetical protein [Candidatus Lokiarchaeota archaeon]